MSSVSDFSTDQVFNNREELNEWVKKMARLHSQVIITKRSKTQNGYLVKIVFMCERGGVYESHAYATRLTNDELRLVDDMADVLTYLHDVWLNKYAHMFVSVATDKSLNFENSTTNRVESQHAKVKSYLGSSQSKLDRFVPIIDNVVKSQVHIIKESFERSRIFRWKKYDHPSFQLLWNLVSLEAIKKIYVELGRLNRLEVTSGNCGCQLRSCFGLPCEHELASYLNAGMCIPLESIDSFWKILSFPSCISTHDENFHFDLDLDMLFHIQEPVVHTNTRGRPSLKMQKQKALLDHEPARHSSYAQDRFNKSEPTIHSSYAQDRFDRPEPGRHSSYAQDWFDRPEPAKQSSYAQDWFDKPEWNQEPVRDSSYVHPSIFSDPLLNEIPVMFRPYVTNIHNVRGDGNCGFRSVASSLGRHENCWSQIRSELLEEIRMHHATYVNIFGEVELKQIYNIIDLPLNTPATSHYWMILPLMGFLIASRYNVVLLFLSNEQDTTCLPLWSSPPVVQPHSVCVIARVHGNHFVKVDLVGDYPVPPTHPQWNYYKNDAEWERLYKNQQDRYHQLRRSNFKSPSFVALSDSD
ncbi:uncharacterized protein [Rutidosis leptorrhynchoides]|uniref:uncharacterized protein n=1 Tax=Rutidosis leptorrhynchoides TaxID=125765 RepID=UPI003A98DF8D